MKAIKPISVKKLRLTNVKTAEVHKPLDYEHCGNTILALDCDHIAALLKEYSKKEAGHLPEIQQNKATN